MKKARRNPTSGKCSRNSTTGKLTASDGDGRPCCGCGLQQCFTCHLDGIVGSYHAHLLPKFVPQSLVNNIGPRLFRAWDDFGHGCIGFADALYAAVLPVSAEILDTSDYDLTESLGCQGCGPCIDCRNCNGSVNRPVQYTVNIDEWLP